MCHSNSDASKLAIYNAIDSIKHYTLSDSEKQDLLRYTEKIFKELMFPLKTYTWEARENNEVIFKIEVKGYNQLEAHEALTKFGKSNKSMYHLIKEE